MPADDRQSRETIMVPSEPYLGFTYNPVPFEILLCSAQQKTLLVMLTALQDCVVFYPVKYF